MAERIIILPLEKVGLEDIALVGGKAASLGEMLQHLTPLGIQIPGGFVITTVAYRQFLDESKLESMIRSEIANIDLTMWNRCAAAARVSATPSVMPNSRMS